MIYDISICFIYFSWHFFNWSGRCFLKAETLSRDVCLYKCILFKNQCCLCHMCGCVGDFSCTVFKSSAGLICSVFQSVLKVLESPNSWDAFRRAGGFTGLLSLVIDMEGALSDPPQGEVWRSIGYQPLLDLLLLTLHILALAVHLHTVNAHHFETGGFYERLGEALLQVGCFYTEGPEREKFDGEESYCPKTAEDNQGPGKSFHQFVELAGASEAPSSPPTTLQPNLPVTLRTCIRLLSYLDQFATGTYSPLELNMGLEPEHRCDEDKEKLNGPAGHEGEHTGSPPVHMGPDPQSVEETQGRTRNTAASVSSVCSESQLRWIFLTVWRW